MGILRGITVLDLAQFSAGPFCAMLLADMGAEVIKVEPPGGEAGRHIAPQVAGEGLYFLPFNRNKRSITLNLRQPRGQQICRDLASRADVLVESFTPGTMEEWGLSYPALRGLNPRLIYASVTGFGQYGPYARRPAFEMIAQAMSGAMYRNGFPDAPPTMIGLAIGDYTAGFYAAIGTVLALYQRQQTGQGQAVDVALLDSMISLLETAPEEYRLTGQAPRRTGSRRRFSAPTNVYRAIDGYLYIGASTQSQWERLANLMDRPALVTDPRFATNDDRVAHADDLDGFVAEWVACVTVAEALAALDGASVPCGKVQDVPEVLADPQVRAREMIVEVQHPVLGNIPMPGIPLKLSESPGEVHSPPPLVGQHNAELYASLLGYDAQTLATLRQEGII